MGRDKDHGEWVVMKYFMEKYDSFPRGRVVKSESPDFIIKISKKQLLGIEITSLSGPSVHFEKFKELAQALNNTLIKKQAKLTLYNKMNMHAIWLIITSDNLHLPVHFNLGEKLEKHGFIHGFEKVFLFDLFTGKIIEIRHTLDMFS